MATRKKNEPIPLNRFEVTLYNDKISVHERSILTELVSSISYNEESICIEFTPYLIDDCAQPIEMLERISNNKSKSTIILRLITKTGLVYRSITFNQCKVQRIRGLTNFDYSTDVKKNNEIITLSLSFKKMIKCNRKKSNSST